jgi:hypothetical protein
MYGTPDMARAALQPIEIFRPGRHTDMSGEALEFSEADLHASAAAYDPALHEAPLTVGHPRHNLPAYGWVRALAVPETDSSLQATPHQVDPAFAEMVRAGRFKKISASFYRPHAPGNPKPGVYYLRHVGFLGAQPPAVKGLRDAEFADDEAGVVTLEFGEDARWGFESIARVLRGLREWLIERDGTETADRVVPDYLIRDTQAVAEDEREAGAAAYSEPTQETPAMPEQQPVDLAEREAELNSREQAIKDREDQARAGEAARRHAEAAAFAERLVEAGKVLPKDRDALVAFMDGLDAEAAIEFGEGDERRRHGAGEWLQEFLEALPPRVDFGEHTPGETQDEQTADFAAPPGYAVDAQQLELHRKALAYQREHDTDYVTAARAVAP